jgi:hypothetical protein
MASSGLMRPLTGWQRANVLAAAQYLRDVLQDAPADQRTRVIYEGLLDALDPARRAVRQQREMADAAKSAVTSRDKRRSERRAEADRRRADLGPPGGIERRKGNRRSGSDRRKVL